MTSSSSLAATAPAAASMRTRTSPNTRCSGGASTSTPRMRSLGTVRTDRESSPRVTTTAAGPTA